MELLLAIVIVALVAAFVAAPFRRESGGTGAAPTSTADPVLADLEARKQAKYREIRDTQLDRAQGKLDEADFASQEAELRAEAIEILKLIDAREEMVRTEGEGGSDEGGRPQDVPDEQSL